MVGLARLTAAAYRPPAPANGAGNHRRFRSVARRGASVCRSSVAGWRRHAVRVLRAPDPRLHHDGTRDRRIEHGGGVVRAGAAARIDWWVTTKKVAKLL